jgi:hypothetical protein
MKPSQAFLRLLPGALALTILRTDLEGEAARAFNEQAADCRSLDELIALIETLSDQRRNGTHLSRIGQTVLFLEGSCLSINLKTVGLGCDVRLRIRTIGQTNSAGADCQIETNGAGQVKEYSHGKATGKELATFIAKAGESGQALTAEAAMLWLKGFGATPDQVIPTKKSSASPKNLELVTARA